MTIDTIVDKLLNAQPDAITVLVQEGLRLEEIAQRFASAGLVSFKQEEFLTYTKQITSFPDASKYPLLQQIPSGRSREGLLFPATYDIPINAGARLVVNRMLETMTTTIQQHNLEQQAAQHQMSLYQMLTLASIVEREAVVAKDRGNIASVYWNRIYRPNDETVSLLQADPTVQYARDTLDPPAKYWQPLQTVGRETAVESPWNTYTHKSFPPTPICSPGLASLKAAATPPTTSFYYFFARKGGNGESVFAVTKQEFEQKIQQYGVNNG
jgi:UPF0755 protein